MRERDTKWDGVPADQLGDTQVLERAARNLTWARELLFRSGAEAARTFGLNQVTYNRYETGERKASIPFLIQFCRVSTEIVRSPDGRGLTLDYFFRSDLSGLPTSLAVRLAAAYPVLLQECEPRDRPMAPSGRTGGGDTFPSPAESSPGKAEVPAA